MYSLRSYVINGVYLFMVVIIGLWMVVIVF